MNPVAISSDFVERPNVGVEIRRLLEIAHAELDAAHSGDLSVRHHLFSGIAEWNILQCDRRHPSSARMRLEWTSQ
jgi:hypothetical protein